MVQLYSLRNNLLPHIVALQATLHDWRVSQQKPAAFAAPDLTRPPLFYQSGAWALYGGKGQVLPFFARLLFYVNNEPMIILSVERDKLHMALADLDTALSYLEEYLARNPGESA